jgi:hypothetical protein
MLSCLILYAVVTACLLVLGSKNIALAQGSRTHHITISLLCLLVVEQARCLQEGQPVYCFSLLYGLF